MYRGAEIQWDAKQILEAIREISGSCTTDGGSGMISNFHELPFELVLVANRYHAEGVIERAQIDVTDH